MPVLAALESIAMTTDKVERHSSGQRPTAKPIVIDPSTQLITVPEFADLARLSRRQIDRLRLRRPPGFPRELELGSGTSKYRSCPRFKLKDVQRWLDSRALW